MSGARTAHERRFAAAVAARASSGWRIADMELTEPNAHNQISWHVVMTRGSAALRFSLEFLNDDDGTTVGFGEGAVTLPSEIRTYPDAATIAAKLATSPEIGLERGCYDIRLGDYDASNMVNIHTEDYYTVAQRWRGAQARRALAAEIERLLGAGQWLADASVDRTRREATFVFRGNGGATIAVAGWSVARVDRLELRRAPWLPIELDRSSYTRGPALRAAVQRLGRVDRIAVRRDADGAVAAVVLLAGPKPAARPGAKPAASARAIIEMEAFYFNEPDCGC